MIGVKQEEILRLILDEHLTQKEICYRLNMTFPRVSLIVKQLKEKGLLSQGRFPSKMAGGGGVNVHILDTTQGQRPIRLHGQIIEARILNSSQRYGARLRSADLIEFEGHNIQLFPDKVVIHSQEGLEFCAPTAPQARRLSRPYWLELLGRLEKFLGVLILKGQNTRLSFAREHYGYVGNELAKDAKDRHEKLNFRAPEDGKIYLTADLSPGEPELETQHPRTALPDMGAFQPMFDDVRANNRGITFTAFGKVIADRIDRGEARLNSRMAEIENFLVGAAAGSAPGDRPDYVG